MSNEQASKGGDIEIPEEIMNWITDQYLQCADDLAYPQLSFNMGALAMYHKMQEVIQMYVEVADASLTTIDKVREELKEKEEREGAAKCLMEIAYGEKRGTEALLSEAIEQNRLLIIRDICSDAKVKELEERVHHLDRDFAALDQIIVQKDEEIGVLRKALEEIRDGGNGRLSREDRTRMINIAAKTLDKYL